MSKLTDELRTIGVFNEYNFAGHSNPYITYHKATTGLGSEYAHWSVGRTGFKVDPDNYRHSYSKEFAVWDRESKVTALAEALQWAGERYKITEWAKTPFGGYMEAGFVKKRLAELKEQVKKGQGKGNGDDTNRTCQDGER